MPAPIGNDYWKLRTRHGRDRKFSSPKKLIDACNEYFEWCINNPFSEQHIVNKQWHEHQEYQDTDDQGNPVTKIRKITHPYSIATTTKMRPFTIEGLCNFIDISVDGFKMYENREGFIGVTTRVRQIIWNQKFEGAAAGFLNHNIIARDLGLIDSKNIEATVAHTEMTREERDDFINRMQEKLKKNVDL